MLNKVKEISLILGQRPELIDYYHGISNSTLVKENIELNIIITEVLNNEKIVSDFVMLKYINFLVNTEVIVQDSDLVFMLNRLNSNPSIKTFMELKDVYDPELIYY